MSFDFNYRAHLWPPEAAVAACAPLAERADLLFIPQRDFALLFADADVVGPDDALSGMHTRFPDATVVITQGEQGAAAIRPDGQVERVRALPVQPVERVGAGDAFVAGYLYAQLTAQPAGALAWASACAAYKMTILGDLPLLERESIGQLIESGGGPSLRR